MTWDTLGRLTAVSGPTGSTSVATYSYDPLDRLRLVDYGGGNRKRSWRRSWRTSRGLDLDASAVPAPERSAVRHVGDHAVSES